jgi:transposase-like protein
VERWRDSGLTTKEFASETGLNASTLAFWRWKLHAQGGRGDSAPRRSSHQKPSATRAAVKRRRASSPRFVEVTAAPVAAPAAAALEIVLGGGTVVRVPAGFDEATLSRVVRALEVAR